MPRARLAVPLGVKNGPLRADEPGMAGPKGHVAKKLKMVAALSVLAQAVAAAAVFWRSER